MRFICILFFIMPSLFCMQIMQNISWYLALKKNHYEVVANYIAMYPNIVNEKVEDEFPLDIVSAHGHPELVQLLIDSGADINRMHKRVTALTWAILHERKVSEDRVYSVVQILIHAKADVDACASSYWQNNVEKQIVVYKERPLHLAVTKNYVGVVALLLEHGANVNSYDEAGLMPLHHASKHGFTECARLLIDYGAYLDERGCALGSRLSSLCFAKVHDHDDIVSLLLDAKADVNIHYKDKTTELHRAIANQELPYVKRLVRYGAHVDSYGNKWATPLKVATLFNDYQIASYLIEQNANINRVDKRDMTPFHLAIIKEMHDFFVLYLFNKADLNKQCVGGGTPLHLSITAHSMREARLLLLLKASPNIPDHNGNTSLHVCVLTDQPNLLNMILNQGGDQNIINRKHQTPLKLAEFANKPDCVHVLKTFRHNTSFSAQQRYEWSREADNKNMTPLHHAAYHGNTGAAQLLLGYNADINAQDNFGNTPLHLAVFKGHAIMESALIEKHADTSIRNKYGLTPDQLSDVKEHYRALKPEEDY